jgi:hypothetical protein
MRAALIPFGERRAVGLISIQYLPRTVCIHSWHGLFGSRRLRAIINLDGSIPGTTRPVDGGSNDDHALEWCKSHSPTCISPIKVNASKMTQPLPHFKW